MNLNSNNLTYCPYCLQQATARTKGIPTHDLCANGHRWLVEKGVVPIPEPTLPLAPCPFCGSESVRILTNEEQAGSLGPHQAWCCACGATGPKRHTEQAAVVAWGWVKR